MSEARPPLWLRWWVADALVIAVCAGSIALAFLLAPGSERVALAGFEIPELCGVKRLTGYPCPGCGLTRSWVYLAHGDWRTALSMNVLGPVLFLAAAVQIPLRSYRIWREARRRARAPADTTDSEAGSCPA